ncbi:hypothetical protein ANMWB30_23050 [Arthrobacter sp. MWB30]|nr:hypothetical protein ANMWB30_23050 [Arthrobacter sp. MWB30]
MSLKITTELTVQPGSGQTQEQAEAEFVQLFRAYLTTKDSAFQKDYGPEAWGGWTGPRAIAVTVHDPEEPAETSPDAPSRDQRATSGH